jgi:hypothetical protein
LELSSRRSAADGELADAYPAGLEHDGSLGEVLLEGGEVGEQECGLLVGAAFGAAAEEEERGPSLAAQGEEGRESVSAETTTRSSVRARSMISSSQAAWRP